MEVNTELQRSQRSQQENLKPEGQTLEAAEAGWLRRLKGRFNSVFSKEETQKEHFPKIVVDMFYSAHSRAYALEGRFERMFKEADIYIPEGIFWNPISLGTIRGISLGNIMPERLKSPSSFVRKQAEIIYNSHKPIAVIDVPYSHPLARKVARFKPPLEGDFSDCLDSIRGLLKNDADKHKEREKYMLSEFKSKIQELLEAYPLLKQKKEIKVLLSLGGFHTGIYHGLKETGQTVTREFERMPYVYSFFDEAERRAMFGKEISRELVAKVFLQMIFMDESDDLFHEMENDRLVKKGEDTTRKLISQFSFEEAEGIFEGLKKGESERQILEAKFAEKGIKLPHSEKELDAFLAKPNSMVGHSSTAI